MRKRLTQLQAIYYRIRSWPYLTLAVDTDDTTGCFMLGSDEDGIAANSVHIETGTRLKVIQMNETELGNNKNNSVFMADLHSNGEIVGSFRREEDFDGFLLEGRVSFAVVNLNDLKLQRTTWNKWIAHKIDMFLKYIPWHRLRREQQRQTTW